MKRLLPILLLCFSGAAAAQGYVFAEIRDPISAGAGWQFSKHLEAELAYYKVDKNITGPSFTTTPPPAGTVDLGTSVTQKVDGLRLSAIGRLPINDSFSLLGSASVYSLHGKLAGDGVDASGSGANYGFGLGASYAFAPKFEVRLMVDWTAKKKDFFGAGANLDSDTSTALALLYRF